MWEDITEAPLREMPSSQQPYDTNGINLVSEPPMPLIPILNNLENNSSGHHFQEMLPMPMPSREAVATNNTSSQISSMLGNRQRKQGHRRFYSEIPTFSNDVSFGSSFGSTFGDASAAGNGVFTFNDLDNGIISKLADLYEPSISSATAKFQVGEQANANLSTTVPLFPPQLSTPGRVSPDAGTSTHRMGNSMHKRSQSMVETADVSRMRMNTSAFDFSILESNKKYFSPEELAEIFRVDPRRAKRILANRRAAAKMKERKNRYKAELEDKVQFLQSQVDNLHMQLAKMKGEASDLIVANKGLQLRLQAIEQSFPLQGALNEVLIEEIEHLKLLTDVASNSGTGQEQQFYFNYNNPIDGIQTAQQLRMNSQPQEHKQ